MWQGHIAGSWSVWCQSGHKVLSCRAPFTLVRPQCVVLSRVISPQVLDFVLSIVELHEVPVDPFLCFLLKCSLAFQPLLPVLRHQQTPWECVLSHHLCHGRRELKIVLEINSRGRALGTVLQMDFVLITTLGAWQFSQLLVPLTVPLSSPYFIPLSMGMLWEAKENRDEHSQLISS